MNIRELCKTRTVTGTAVETPLLVPSYSSRGFNVGSILEDTCEYYENAKLISAYDIYYKLVAHKHIFSADLLFIDSGHYEKIATNNPGEPYEDERPGTRKWNLELYRKTLKSLSTEHCQLVRVTYDRHLPVAEQIALATPTKKDFPEVLTDFLIKSEPNGSRDGRPRTFLDWHAVAANAGALEFADIVGFTEKEMGGSYRERAEFITHVREALNGAGLNQPIHVFGCLDPFGVLIYQAAGADIFDGLSWLRFAWSEGVLSYIPSALAAGGYWQDNVEKGTRATQIGNLSQIRMLASAVRSLTRSGNFTGVKSPWNRYAGPVKDLLEEIGVELEDG